MINHPLSFIPNDKRRTAFYFALAATLVVMAIFRLVLDPPLQSQAAPQGIVSFELARTPEKAQEILLSWDNTAQLYAAFGLGFDFLFMPIYATAIALGVLLAAGRHPGGFASLGAWIGWGAYAAMLFDAVENICLFSQQLGSMNTSLAPMAAGCATFKFGLILLGIGYALIGWAWPKKK